MSRELPAKPDIEHLKNQAKDCCGIFRRVTPLRKNVSLRSPRRPVRNSRRAACRGVRIWLYQLAEAQGALTIPDAYIPMADYGAGTTPYSQPCREATARQSMCCCGPVPISMQEATSGREA